ncbi:polysaccharide pyruvyl transferase family protein, partial [Demequina sp.]|uniref:polysaccharide pyruvyl transferase family protein n=1 Tax=Demequina sp. TaxID=2050685 RepID=UPI0026014526
MTGMSPVPWLSPADAAVLAEIRASTLAVLEEVVGRGARVAVLDAPNQRNVGDSMIWAGEVAYFRALGLDVAYVADIDSYRADAVRAAVPEDGVVLLHGGGNFGDLWRGHQSHRERIAKELPDRRIVQLPQSIWFEEPKRAANANRIIGGHPDFTLLVRDHESEARAAEQLPAVPRRYCWDMALGWTPTRSPGPAPEREVLVLAREDKEGASGLDGAAVEAAAGVPVEVADWTSATLDTAAWRAARRVPALAKRRPGLLRSRAFRRLLAASIGWINEANVRAGVSLYRGRRLVVVDRLHAHVLAVLLGIDHVMLDNNYGKLGAVFRDYTHRFSTASYATDVTEAAS